MLSKVRLRRLLDWLGHSGRLNRIGPPIIIGIPVLITLLGWPSAPLRQQGSFDRQNPSKSLANAEPIQPLPLTSNVDPQKVVLGEKLFHDGKLSKDGSVSCATCHDLKKGGTDGLPRSRGMRGQMGDINSPTVFNAAFNFRQFWDGRAADLEEQMNGPVGNPAEMDSSWEHVIGYLKRTPAYRKSFQEIFGGPPTPPRVRAAIAEFERSLITPNSRFDRYLRGDSTALTPDELAGYQLFKRNGCVACHQGRNIGGNMFQTFGVLGNYFADRGSPITKADLGRYNVTKQESDKHVFKVPSLRNVALTAPYFHDGSAATLERAVEVMARYQLGRTFTGNETAKIVAFLKTLTGEYRGSPL